MLIYFDVVNISGFILGMIILDSSQRIFSKLLPEETEEDEERNDNICLQTHNQSSKQSLNSKTEAHSLSLSVDSRGAGQQRRMWRKMRIFADKQSNKQILIQRLSHTLILCGYLESGPIYQDVALVLSCLERYSWLVDMGRYRP